MSNLPNRVKNRSAIDPKLAVGSSLSKPKELIALTILLYILNNEKEYLEYCDTAGDSIHIKTDLIAQIKDYFLGVDNFNEENINNLRNENSLCLMQLEPLQVSLQLVWKLAKIRAVNSFSSSQERTGNVRVPKSLDFTTNISLIKSILSDDQNNLYSSSKTLLYRWIFNEIVETPLQKLEQKLKSTLLIFTEDTLYKTWLTEENELIFQQEGVYEQINNETDIVNLKGAKEIKGTLRNFKSLLSHNLHPYLKINTDDVSLRDLSLLEEFKTYKNKVSSFLDLTPKSIEIVEIESEIPTESEESIQSPNITSHQIIFYGSPGTGKSREIEILTNRYNKTRTTFHPETDYHSFVGSYKPTMDGDNIRYDFIPQSFTKAYCNAWLNPDQPYFLIIEEINRGNCAQIFGDLFQSLDRDDNGMSKYEINCDKDLAKHIKEVFEGSGKTEIISQYKAIIRSEDFDKIILPNNLYIYATMNTSDQSLFPMDSAFKRRWDWQYIPINYEDANTLKIEIKDNKYNWGNFIKIINPKIRELTGSEDKQLGNRFVNPSDKIIRFDQFRSKVLFYLWSEVYKDEFGTQNSIFKYERQENNPVDFQFGELYEENAKDLVEDFLKFNGITPE